MAGLREPEAFTITHPFHPLSGQTFCLDCSHLHRGVTYLHFKDKGGNDRSVRSSWTDLDERAGRSLVAERRSTFSYESLVELRHVLDAVAARSPEEVAEDENLTTILS